MWVGRGFFALLFIGTLVIGLMVPTFYDWSGADQSRSSPAAERGFYIGIGFALITLLALPWLPIKLWPAELSNRQEESDSGVEQNPGRFQFNVRTLLLAMSAVAFTIVGLGNYRLESIMLLVCTSLVLSMWVVTHRLSWKWQGASLFACMYFPWAWTLVHRSFLKDGDASTLYLAVGFPGFLPVLFAGGYFGHRVDESPWILVALTVILFAIGFWMIRLGPKRTIAWMILVFCSSFLGSCFLNVAIRI
jgi:hypothetical protein